MEFYSLPGVHRQEDTKQQQTRAANFTPIDKLKDPRLRENMEHVGEHVGSKENGCCD